MYFETGAVRTATAVLRIWEEIHLRSNLFNRGMGVNNPQLSKVCSN